MKNYRYNAITLMVPTSGQGEGHKGTGKGTQTDTDRDMDMNIDNFNGQLTKNKSIESFKF
jgi:hypothetical protein